MIIEVYKDKCTGCNRCFSSCPLDVFRLDTHCEEAPPCQIACPAGVDMRGYMYLLKQGKLEEAIGLIRETLPLPAITGHVCFHPCETDCARKEVDKAVNINAIERFIADYWLQEKAQPVPRLHVARIAIIGSGPAGLSNAYFLHRMGYPVSVFEAMAKPGGMLRAGIPEYRLPRKVLDLQIEYLQDMGIEFVNNTRLGQDLSIDDLKDKGYKAVFLAIGNQLSRKFAIKGSQLEGVLWGLDFLREVNLKRKVKIGDRVLVIGGGDVAIDAALSALRLGAKEVEIACLECSEEMPAHPAYTQLAIEEGIKISPSLGPKQLIGENGNVSAVELVRCTSVFDREGRFNPCLDNKVSKSVSADAVIFAIGQALETSDLPRQILKKGTIIADRITLETPLPGIFAGGDAVSGPSSVVEAIASGRQAAISIDRFCRGQNARGGKEKKSKTVQKPPREGIDVKTRQEEVLLPVGERKRGFREIRTALSEAAALLEADRCMTCGSKAYIAYPEDCMTCYTCEIRCPYDALYVHPFKEVLPYSI